MTAIQSRGFLIGPGCAVTRTLRPPEVVRLPVFLEVDRDLICIRVVGHGQNLKDEPFANRAGAFKERLDALRSVTVSLLRVRDFPGNPKQSFQANIEKEVFCNPPRLGGFFLIETSKRHPFDAALFRVKKLRETLFDIQKDFGSHGLKRV